MTIIPENPTVFEGERIWALDRGKHEVTDCACYSRSIYAPDGQSLRGPQMNGEHDQTTCDISTGDADPNEIIDSVESRGESNGIRRVRLGYLSAAA